MAGFPQLREAGWLYGEDDPYLPLALVRLFEHMDGARGELARIYADGERDGRWRVRQPEAY